MTTHDPHRRPAQRIAALRTGLLALAIVAGLVTAQSTPLEVRLERFQVVDVTEDGEVREELRSVVELAPGDTVEEIVHVANTGDDDLQAVGVVLPVPEGTRFLEGSALPLDLAGEPVEPEFSYDGGASYGVPPLTRIVIVEEDGRDVEKEVVVPPEEYTHARWVLPLLEAQSTVTARLRAVVR